VGGSWLVSQWPPRSPQSHLVFQVARYPKNVRVFRWLPDSQRIAVVNISQSLFPTTIKSQQPLWEHSTGADRVSWSLTGNVLTLFEVKKIQVLDLQSGQILWDKDEPETRLGAISPDGA
jgi:hypothetical protein